MAAIDGLIGVNTPISSPNTGNINGSMSTWPGKHALVVVGSIINVKCILKFALPERRLSVALVFLPAV